MDDLHFEAPVTEEVEVDAGALAGIDRGMQSANEGATIPLEEVRKMIPTWISTFESRKRP